MDKKIPCVYYLYIHKKLKERSTADLMSIRDAVGYLAEWRLPKELRIAILKELEMMQLISKEDRNYIRINYSSIDISTVNKIYDLVGIIPE